MNNFEKKVIDLPCPGCGRSIEVSYYELYTRRKPKCRRCGSYYEISSMHASKLRSEVKNIQRDLDRIEDVLKDIFNESGKRIK